MIENKNSLTQVTQEDLDLIRLDMIKENNYIGTVKQVNAMFDLIQKFVDESKDRSVAKESIVNKLDDIFVTNKKICENGISDTETINRLVEINNQIEDIKTLI